MMKQRKVSPKPSAGAASSGSVRSVSTASAAPKPSANRVRSQSVATRGPNPISGGSHGAGARGRSAKFASKTDDDAAAAAVADDDDLYRVRSFTTKTGALVNRGDSFKRRGPKADREDPLLSTTTTCPPQTGGVFRSPPPPPPSSSSLPLSPLSSSPSGRTEALPQETIPLGTGKIVCSFSTGNAGNEVRTEDSSSTAPSNVEPSGRGGPQGRHHPPTSGGAVSRKSRYASTGEAYGDEDSEVPPVYKVLVLGSQGVGKTTLTRQFLSSEYYSSDCANAADDRDDETVTVMLDEEESVIQFIDSPGIDVGKIASTPHSEGRFDARLGSREFGKTAFAGDGFLVVYSVTDRSSFGFAQTCLQELRPSKRHNAVILVANKHDLVRNRLVPETDGIKLATKRQCKFIEVSALLDHRLDELLVGIVRQIRLRQSTAGLGCTGIRSESTSSEGGGGGRGRTGNRLSDTIGAFLQKIFRRDRTTGGKCEDLLVP